MVKRKHDDLVPTWVSMYEEGKTLREISEDFGVHPQFVGRKLGQFGFKLRSKQVAIRKYDLNVDAFSSLDCPEACYWLGLFYADGCLGEANGSYRVSLVAHIDDIELIHGFCRFLGTDRPIEYRSDKKCVTVAIGSKQLGESLVAMGLTPRKTHTMRFPVIPSQNRRHFIRGLFDGDGCVGLYRKARYVTLQGKASYSSNPKMSEDVSRVIEEDIGLSPTSRFLTKDGRNMSIGYEGKNRLMVLRGYLYESGGSSLARKKEIFYRIGASDLPLGYGACAAQCAEADKPLAD